MSRPEPAFSRPLDLPHVLGWLFESQLKDYQEVRQTPTGSDQVEGLYRFPPGTEYCGFELDTIAVCGQPLWLDLFGRHWSPNSGSHRVVFSGWYQGERAAIAVEEKEDWGCGPLGDVLHIGATGVFRDDVEVLGAPFIADILSGLVSILTGVEIQAEATYYDSAISRPNGFPHRVIRQRYEMHLTTPEALEAEGCRLSPEGRSCVLFSFADVLKHARSTTHSRKPVRHSLVPLPLIFLL